MRKKLIIISLFLLTLITISVTQTLSNEKSVAKVSYIVGKATDASQNVDLSINDPLYAGATIQTGNESLCELTLSDQSIIRIGEKSEYQLNPPKKQKSSSIFGFLGIGKVWVKLKKLVDRKSYAIKSPSSVISVRGTTFSLSVSPDKSGSVDVFEGRVDAGTHWILQNDSLFDAWVRQDEAAYKEWLEANDPNVWVKKLEDEYKDAIEKMEKEEEAFYNQDALEYENFLREEQGLPPIVPENHGPLAPPGEGGWLSFVRSNQTLNFSGESDVHTVAPMTEAVEEDPWTKFNRERDAEAGW